MATLVANPLELPLISVEEYLRTFYRPDCDDVDGVVEQRHLGEVEPSRLQTRLTFLFCLHGKDWGIEAFTECRLQVAPRRFRVPDVMVFFGHAEARS